MLSFVHSHLTVAGGLFLESTLSICPPILLRTPALENDSKDSVMGKPGCCWRVPSPSVPHHRFGDPACGFMPISPDGNSSPAGAAPFGREETLLHTEEGGIQSKREDRMKVGDRERKENDVHKNRN